MDQGPFRMQRPTGGAADKPEQTRRHSEEPEQPREEPKPVHHRPASVPPKPHRIPEDKDSWIKRFKTPLLIVATVVVLVIITIAVWPKSQSEGSGVTGIASDKYQAVFFTNGQVYFGKLTGMNSDYMKLTDIFYLQTQADDSQVDPENPQQTTTNQDNVQLIKLGSEIHGPEDEMIISKEQVLFYENLKTDGKVAQSIEKYKSENK